MWRGFSMGGCRRRWRPTTFGAGSVDQSAAIRRAHRAAIDTSDLAGAILGAAMESTDFSQCRAGARQYCGDASPIIRCQLHKRRNICDHFAEEDQQYGSASSQMPMTFAVTASPKWRCSGPIHHELNHVNPSTARSLEEGVEKTLTLHRLQVPIELWKMLRSTTSIFGVPKWAVIQAGKLGSIPVHKAATNVIESAFSIVRVVCAT